MADLPPPEMDGTSIVLVGAFNPRIFQPAWFVRNGLLPQGVEAEANVEIVNNDVCVFETDWFRIEVLSDRFLMASIAAPAPEALRDLVAGTFRILKHTPVQKIGINTHVHFALPSEDRWHEFGHELAPKKVLWDPIMKQPGTLSLTIQGQRDDEFEGHTKVKVEPSGRVANGIFLETNDEYRQMESDSAGWVDDILSEEWDRSRIKALEIRDHVIHHALYRGN